MSKNEPFQKSKKKTKFKNHSNHSKKVFIFGEIVLFLFHHTKLQHITYIRVQRRGSLFPEELFYLSPLSILGFAINCRRQVRNTPNGVAEGDQVLARAPTLRGERRHELLGSLRGAPTSRPEPRSL